ncbi:putative methionyl-tRNA formyltransferase [Trypanosoma rangeli]|uniref:Putative methionyl-tRNA formyltransferase n=1 Tax=Trypanosoma rangeli TaxID=5698 RepID=A0A422MWR6_TRYRA|nr:putative methionyl-tRNA formyltransferase [Trypanosoma rangeli]RNE97662.1 putative methionyl-tRNA formyltransferase [Trypanosoma rangeli]|eukprot:RNE97662.1 putative methionyl-tRNA formyltransferase [Trypanosoma rangeli]
MPHCYGLASLCRCCTLHTTCSRGGGENSGGATKREVLKTPSIVFFGGDIVSLVALKMLRERLECIRATETVAASDAGLMPPSQSHLAKTAEGKQQLVVVCPFLPADPSVISQRHTRQYPVARYCVKHNIPLIPVDHPTSMARSTTLRYLLNPWRAGEQSSSAAGKQVMRGEEENRYLLGQPLEAFDVAVVVSFRYFIPKKLLERLPRTVNLHPSLLPRYRGASPIFAPLLRCDEVGGASVIKLSPEQRLMDSGDVLWQKSMPIPHDMSIREYFPRVTEMGATGLCECIFGGGPSARAPEHDWRDVEDADDAVAKASMSPTCDWPRTFNARWVSAWPQRYDVHFTKDPYHAPLLPKNRAVIRWGTMTAEEAYGTWRAFVGGDYYNPTVNATLDKGATPVREQLLHRLLARAAREIRTLSHYRQSKDGTTELRGNEERIGKKDFFLEGVGVVKEEAAEMPLTMEPHPNHLQRHLLISCTFTNAVHPKDVPSAVIRELHQLEKGEVPIVTRSAYEEYQHQQQEKQKHQQHYRMGVYIKPGSAYFPRSVDEMCAVKCREGWFVWQAAALKGSTSQPAGLLCKGMGMKTGVLYVGLFVENNNGESESPAVNV